MGEVPLSLHIKAETNRRLKEEAQRQDVSADNIAEQAIDWYVESQELERQILQQRAAEADKGVFISSEAMLRWMKERLEGKKTPQPAPDVFLKPRQS